MSADCQATTDEPSGENQKTATRRKFVAGVGAGAAALAVGSGSAVAATSGWTSGRGGLNWDSEWVQNPWIAEGEVTKAKHHAKWGLSLDAMRFFENNSGNKEELPGYVPTKDSTPEHGTDNVVSLRADKIGAPGFSKFPRGVTYDGDGDGDADEDVTALDATHWSTTGATNGSITVENADKDVTPALRIYSTGLADGETVKATFTDVDIQSDAAKRFLAGIADLATLGTNATVEVVARDDDGDEKALKAVAGGDTSKTAVWASSTGQHVFQQRNADVATSGSGDGTFDSITEVEVRISASGGASDADLTLTALDCERKSTWAFGSYVANEGTDSEEVRERVRPSGSFTVTSLDTMEGVLAADGTTFYDVSVPFRYTLEAEDEAFEYQFTEATQYQGYDYKFTVRGKQEVPQAIDITHTGLSWKDQVAVPAARYTEVWTATGVGDTELSEIADSSKTSHAGSYDSEGATVTLNSSLSAGSTHAYGATLLFTQANRDTVEMASGGGGGGQPADDDGAISGVLGMVGAAGATFLAFLGGLKKGWW